MDLNLLVVFHAMVEQRSVTRAGEAVGLSQPAMSAAVARLRRLFDDPLFVRTGPEMKPTPRALELAAAVARVIETVKTDILKRPGFNPATAAQTFTLLTPDIGEVHFLPRLLSRLADEAPHARLRTLARPQQAAADTLASGEAELAIGYFPDLQKAGFYQQKLFDNRHVCLVRKGHPTIHETMTLKDYEAAAHAVVRPDGREHLFEQFIQHRSLQRRVVLELSHFMSLLPIIASSDLVATVPLDLATVCQRYADVRIVESPVKSPVIAVRQFWHARFNKDPVNVWLRAMVRALFMTRPVA